MSLKLGLTGSIGMGKTTTAGFFKEFGVPVWDADEQVHTLYAKGGAAVEPIAALLPTATKNGFVDRNILKAEIAKKPILLSRLEEILKPLLAKSRNDFLLHHKDNPLILFDIPLLFETDTESWLDYVLVVSAPEQVQRERLLARGTMDEAMLETLLSRQMPDAEKRALADFVFDTSFGMAHTKSEVKSLIKRLNKENA
ncbi:MAG: dephospho-CoA kinase [Rhodobacteraceae bacterium]|nr:dephospho-CoA kinase [Paracoccaceae bacterium]